MGERERVRERVKWRSVRVWGGVGEGVRRARVAGVYGLQMWRYGVLAGAMRAWILHRLGGTGVRARSLHRSTQPIKHWLVGEREKEKIGLKHTLSRDCIAEWASRLHLGCNHTQADPSKSQAWVKSYVNKAQSWWAYLSYKRWVFCKQTLPAPPINYDNSHHLFCWQKTFHFCT